MGLGGIVTGAKAQEFEIYILRTILRFFYTNFLG